jgi:hypothetical protein
LTMGESLLPHALRMPPVAKTAEMELTLMRKSRRGWIFFKVVTCNEIDR